MAVLFTVRSDFFTFVAFILSTIRVQVKTSQFPSTSKLLETGTEYLLWKGLEMITDCLEDWLGLCVDLGMLEDFRENLTEVLPWWTGSPFLRE